MNNADQPFISAPLELMGGLYTEAAPESLPLGASPLVVNCDFILGSVHQRPGKQTVFFFGADAVEKVTGFASSVPGAFAPNEVPWSSPSNAQLNTPGTYAALTLNGVAVPNGPGQVVQFLDTSATDSAGTIGTLTPTGPNQVALICASAIGNIVVSPGAELIPANSRMWVKAISSPTVFSATWLAAIGFAATAVVFGTSNGTMNVVQSTSAQSTIFSNANPLTTSPPLVNGVNPNNTVIVCLEGICNNGSGQPTYTVTDDQGNVYTQIAAQLGGRVTSGMWICLKPLNGPKTFKLSVSGGSFTGNTCTIDVIEVSNLTNGGNVSQVLQSANFPFSIPSTQQVVGFEIEIDGHQTSTNPDALLSVSLSTPAPLSPVFTAQLPTSDGPLILGGLATNWGLPLTPALFNNPNFGINIVASAFGGTNVGFAIYAVQIKLFLSPNPAPSFNYLKTFARDAGEVLTMALGSDGVFYVEDAINNPGSLAAAYTAIQPNSFAQSATVDDREFIAISNLKNGTDIPYTYTPPNFDRLSQVGPGAPPSASSSSTGLSIVSITQPPVMSDVVNPGHLSGILWSAGPGSTAVGNVLTVYYNGTNNLPNPDPNVVVGAGVQLAAIDSTQFAGQTVNGDYIIISIGQGVPPGAAQSRWYFTVQMPSSQSINQANHIEPHAPSGTYQVTTATLTASAQVPNLQVGGTLQIAGTGGAPTTGYDGSWTVNATPNASQLQITSTQLQGNIATFGYNLITGTAPMLGQLITITGTLNGNGIFNLANVAISATSPGTFSVQLFGPNINSAPETGSAIVLGTVFQFDPLVIVGNKTGGSLVTTGVISAGIRKVCYSYLTRNGFLTQPSPILTFDVTAGAASIVISNLLPGPANVIARVIHLTAANGGQFYNIPEPVVVNNNGTNVTNTSTWVNDNSTMSVSLSFADGVLLAADEIDIQGNNLFENIELGSCVALIPFAQRLFAVGEQNKITNLLNYSFDGGIAGGAGSTATYPAGWVIDPVNGAGGAVVNSPIFGFAYQINNQSGVAQAIYGMITQEAFQDEFLVPIFDVGTTYSVRVTCSVPVPASGGNLVVDLFSPKFNKSFGSFSVPLASIATSMQILTGTLLTTPFSPVPSDLVIRIYATNIANGIQVLLDRIEPFPTEEPTNSSQVIASYEEAFEQFDRLTGPVLANQQNQQPVVTAFVQSGNLYLVKTHSMVAVANNDSTEPSFWNKPRLISPAVGALGPYAVTFAIDQASSGEDWALLADLAGLFLFQGSQPIKLSEEIQSVWNQINFAFGFTVWVVNDIVNRRVLVGVPLKALNAQGKTPTWLPVGLFTDNNPQTPNAILEMNYKQLNTASAVANDVQVHRSYSGKLIASDIVRKWSIWTIKAPCAAFVQRADTTMPLFLGNSDNNGKVFQLIEGLFADDGNAIDQLYATAGFMPTEAAQGMQLGITRFTFEYATAILNGAGVLTITVYPNSLDSPYAHALLPNLTLPASTNGDVEFPVNESGSRLFLIFGSNTVGAGYQLDRLIVMMTKDPWSPVRGVNQ